MHIQTIQAMEAEKTRAAVSTVAEPASDEPESGWNWRTPASAQSNQWGDVRLQTKVNSRQ